MDSIDSENEEDKINLNSSLLPSRMWHLAV